VESERALAENAESFTDENAQFEAQLTSEVISKHTYNTVEVRLMDSLTIKNYTLPKNGLTILVKMKKFQELRIGDVCTFRGTFKVPENFDDFAYKDYLENNNIYLIMDLPDINCSGQRKGFWLQNRLVDFKNSLNAVIANNLKEPQSSLLMGIIFGQDRLFSTTFDRNIRIAGVSHIVAASGYNITILILAGNILLKWLPQRIRILILIAIIWCFCILSGLSPSILRACIMTTISLIALFLGKKNSIHITLPLASCLFVIIDPKIIFNIGFQLSVSATVGLIYLQPTFSCISELIFKKRFSFLVDTVFPTLSCTLATIPFTIYTFNTVSIWSVGANILILPVIESTMFFGLLGICFSQISLFVSKFFFETVNVQLKYFELVVNTIGSIHWGYWELDNISITIPIVMAVVLVLTCIYYYPVKDESYNYYIKISS
jgi:competence protein ComEC